jgi:hypothetical protein
MFFTLRFTALTLSASFALLMAPAMLPDFISISGSAKAQKGSEAVCKAAFGRNKPKIESLAEAGNSDAISVILAKANCPDVMVKIADRPRTNTRHRITCSFGWPPPSISCSYAFR